MTKTNACKIGDKVLVIDVNWPEYGGEVEKIGTVKNFTGLGLPVVKMDKSKQEILVIDWEVVKKNE